VVIGGSQQLRIFRRAIRDGMLVEDAAEVAGMAIGEARLTAAEDAKNPPPEEAYALLNTEEPIMSTDHVAGDEIRLLIERYERLDEEKRGIADDQKDVMAEAKGRGYDPKILRKLVAVRKKKREAVQEENALFETYANALGMQYALI
jgi:uncharacterized protein (UPF0335 family)